MGVIAAAAGIFLGLALFAGAFSVRVGAKLAKLPTPSFSRSISIAIASVVSTWVFPVMMGSMVDSLWGFLVGQLFGQGLTLWIISKMPSTRISQVLVIWLLGLAAQVLAFVITGALFGGAVGEAVWNIIVPQDMPFPDGRYY